MFCPECGTEQHEGARFCKACGKPVGGEQLPQSAAAPQAPPAPAVPPPAAPPSPGYPAAPYAAAKPERSKTPIILGIAGLAAVIGVVAVVLVVTLGGGGSSGIAGKYYSLEDGELLELKSDGTFIIGESGWVEGTYEVDGNKIYLTASAFGYEADAVGTIEGKRLTVEGEVYVKR